MADYKKCPYRVMRSKFMSATISHEYTEIDQFYDCMGEECAAYEDGYCKRNPYVSIYVKKDQYTNQMGDYHG